MRRRNLWRLTRSLEPARLACMALRWKTFHEVPENIRARYYFGYQRSANRVPVPQIVVDLSDTTSFHGNLDVAATIYWDRNIPILFGDIRLMSCGRRRYYQPVGIRDKGNRWFPLPIEVQNCCKKLIPPSFRFPWAWRNHCNTIQHVALLVGVDPKELKGRIDEDLGVLAPIPVLPRRCRNCGKFALKDKEFCKQHQWVEDQWALFDKEAQSVL